MERLDLARPEAQLGLSPAEREGARERLRRALTLKQFEAWLRAQDAVRARYRPDDSCECPLAAYCCHVLDHDATMVEIHSGAVHTDCYWLVDLPPWARRFVGLFDAHYEMSTVCPGPGGVLAFIEQHRNALA